MNSAQLLSIIALVIGSGGSFVAYRTAGAQSKKTQREGGEVYVRASDGAVVTMQRVKDELEEDRDYWQKRCKEAEKHADELEKRLREL